MRIVAWLLLISSVPDSISTSSISEPSFLIVISPFFNGEMRALWFARMVISPAIPGTDTETTSPSKIGPSTREIVSFSCLDDMVIQILGI